MTNHPNRSRRDFAGIEKRLEVLLVKTYPELAPEPQSFGCVRADRQSKGGGFWIHHQNGVNWSPYDQAAAAVEAGEAGAKVVLTVMDGVRTEAA